MSPRAVHGELDFVSYFFNLPVIDISPSEDRDDYAVLACPGKDFVHRPDGSFKQTFPYSHSVASLEIDRGFDHIVFVHQLTDAVREFRR